MFEELIGKEIAGCKIIKKLGEGGMGVAYSAHHERLDRAVVVKFLDPEVAKDPKQVEGCLAEARAAAKLEHPRIVQVYDQGSQDGLHFIVMQLVDGETAEDLLIREKKLEPIKAVRIVRAALEGLAEAHKAGIVHRDIKPSNILLGKDGSIRLSDFGLALKMTKEGKAKGQIIGTPLYMSPEQIWGQEVDGRCDIYSMGATLYHFITGSPPFAAASPSDIIAMHINNPPPDANAANPDVSKYASSLISKMMAKNPEERPATALEVITALDSPAMIMADASVTGERQIDLGIKPGSRPPRSFSGDVHAPTPVDPQFTTPPSPRGAPPPEGEILPKVEYAPGAWRAPAAGLLMLLAGISAYVSGFLAQPLLLAAPLVLIGAAAALARKGAGVLAPAMIVLGAAALFWAGIEGASPESLAEVADRRALYLPVGLISALAALLAAPGLSRARWPSALILACAAVTAPALFVFALPEGHGWRVLLDNSARHSLALPLLFAGPLCSLLAALIYRNETNTAGPVSMILAGTLAVYAAGAVHSRPQPPKPKQKETANAPRKVIVVIENGQTVVKEAPLPEDLEAAAEKNRPPKMLRPLTGYPQRFQESGAPLPAGGALLLLGSILYWRRTRRTPVLFES